MQAGCSGRDSARETGDERPFASDPDEARAAERELLARARNGDRAALSALYTHNLPLAEHVARRTCRPCDVDDVVAEAFTKTFDQIRRGGGPRESFRAYLITAVRATSADTASRYSRDTGVPLVDSLQGGITELSADTPGSNLRVESELLTAALSTLPARWQLALWWASVEGRPLSDVGQELAINANAAAALVFRAREGLRSAYLDLHLPPTRSPGCSTWRPHLPAFARDRLKSTREAGTRRHLASCLECRDVVTQLRQLMNALPV